MLALVLTAPRQFEPREMPDPVAGHGEVVVRIESVGICGSDVHGMDGSTGRRRPPIVMGHEAAGVVESVGPGVGDWKVGDRVTFDSTIYCGVCYFCRRGRVNLCDARRVLGVSCAEYRQDGAMAQRVRVPGHILYRLPDSLGFDEAAMVEPLSVAVHAVGRAQVALGDTAVVVGAGVIGLLIIQSLRAAGCSRVIAVDVDATRLDLASRVGADVLLRANDGDPAADVLRHTAGRGADLAFDAVGLAATPRAAVDSLRKGGRLVLVGNVSPVVDAPLQTIVTREISLVGSCASSGEYPACLDLMARGKIDMSALISATAPLREGGAWFDRLHAREPGLLKVMLHPFAE